jgi:hypothetical protein
MIKYEYSSFTIPLTDFHKRALYDMNDYGSVGWHIFHLHEMVIDGVPSMAVFMARKLEENS